jgi:phage baseplate assembly protein W
MPLNDIYHQFGSDLLVGPTGDLATVTGTLLGQQRVLRRLLTNPGDYIWQLTYGAGLAQFVGQPAVAARIAAVIRSQIFQESAVAATPAPVIDVQPAADGSGSIAVQVRYADADADTPQILTFTVNPPAN